MSERTEFGPCCLCEAPEANVIWMIEKRGQQDKPGWGCFQCGLGMEGAVAVLCEMCATLNENVSDFTWRNLRFYCDGKERRPIAELLDAPDWQHDLSKHQELSLLKGVDTSGNRVILVREED